MQYCSECILENICDQILKYESKTQALDPIFGLCLNKRNNMKKKILFFGIFLLSVFLFIMTFINNKNSSIIEIENISDINILMTTKDAFFIQISRENCGYCKILEDKEKEIDYSKIQPFYKYVFDKNINIKTMAQMKEIFSEFEYVPVFFYVKNGEVVSELIVSDWKKPEKEIMDWALEQK